ncbi:MAG: hypothetical protein HKN97_14460 [Myxococcales bacterium]|nr:hypothetical protein [Myxococcales bacterium]
MEICAHEGCNCDVSETYVEQDGTATFMLENEKGPEKTASFSAPRHKDNADLSPAGAHRRRDGRDQMTLECTWCVV